MNHMDKLNTDVEENDEIVLSEDFGDDLGEELTFAEEPEKEEDADTVVSVTEE